KDKNFWSVRVSSDIRIIVHKTTGSLLLCYVGHHDKAYDWAERRKLEAHPKTGAAQIVEIRETVKEIVVPVYVQEELPVRRITPKPHSSKTPQNRSYLATASHLNGLQMFAKRMKTHCWRCPTICQAKRPRRFSNLRQAASREFRPQPQPLR